MAVRPVVAATIRRVRGAKAGPVRNAKAARSEPGDRIDAIAPIVPLVRARLASRGIVRVPIVHAPIVRAPIVRAAIARARIVHRQIAHARIVHVRIVRTLTVRAAIARVPIAPSVVAGPPDRIVSNVGTVAQRLEIVVRHRGIAAVVASIASRIRPPRRAGTVRLAADSTIVRVPIARARIARAQIAHARIVRAETVRREVVRRGIVRRATVPVQAARTKAGRIRQVVPASGASASTDVSRRVPEGGGSRGRSATMHAPVAPWGRPVRARRLRVRARR
ncbi:MAG: hypothetical protein ACREOU_16790 [Candidatus Eiseniibacteriota bacterium]